MSALTKELRQSFIQLSSPAKLLLLLLLVLFFLILGSVSAILLSVPVFGYELKSLYQLIENPEPAHIGIVKFFQMVQSVFLFLLPALFAAWLFSQNSMNYLKTDRRASLYTLTLVLVSLFVAVPLMNAVTYYNSMLDLPTWLNGLENKIKAMEKSAGKLTELFLESHSYRDLAVNFLMIAILPALGEEFLFRGVLQNLFIEWTKSRHAGVIMAAFLFSFIHFQFYGFIPRFLLGLYFGYLLVWSSSMWVPVAAHLINNGFAVLYYHFSVRPVGDTAMDKIGTSKDGTYILLLSIFLTAMIILGIYLYEKQKKFSAN